MGWVSKKLFWKWIFFSALARTRVEPNRRACAQFRFTFGEQLRDSSGSFQSRWRAKLAGCPDPGWWWFLGQQPAPVSRTWGWTGFSIWTILMFHLFSVAPNLCDVTENRTFEYHKHSKTGRFWGRFSNGPVFWMVGTMVKHIDMVPTIRKPTFG